MNSFQEKNVHLPFLMFATLAKRAERGLEMKDPEVKPILMGVWSEKLDRDAMYRQSMPEAVRLQTNLGRMMLFRMRHALQGGSKVSNPNSLKVEVRRFAEWIPNATHLARNEPDAAETISLLNESRALSAEVLSLVDQASVKVHN